MGLLDRIFGYKRIKLNIDKTAPVPNANSSCNENCVKLMHFYSCIAKLYDVVKEQYKYIGLGNIVGQAFSDGNKLK
ncbi:MAG: hypothetical protein SPI84_05765 [Anaerovoracaceae bacterium]|nr:hypothetical protein [Anaerovoracaceae bacterium]